MKEGTAIIASWVFRFKGEARGKFKSFLLKKKKKAQLKRLIFTVQRTKTKQIERDSGMSHDN